MGVGQIRPVVKCRAPYRAVRGSPAARGKTKRGFPAPWDCAAADNTPRPPPAAGVSAELRARMKGKRRSVVNPQPGDSPVPRGEGMRPTTLPGRRRRTSRGTGNCPAPREVLPLLKKADVQASTLPGDSTELREDVHAVRKRLPESHAARKTRRTPRLPPKTRQRRPRRRAGKNGYSNQEGPPPRPPFPRGKKRAPRPQRRRSARKAIVFLRGCGRWPKQKVAPQHAEMTEQSPRLPDGRAGFFLPIGSEWLTTGAWTPCEP